MLEVTSCVRKGGTHAPVHARRRDESEQQAASEDREKENRSNVNTVIVEEPEQVNMTGKQGQTMQRNKAVKEEKKGRRDESEGTKPAGSNYLVDGNDADRIAFLETSKHSTNNKMEKKQMTILSFFSRLSSSSPSSLSAASSFLSFPCPSSPSAASSSSSSLSVRCSSSPPSSLPLFLVPSALSRVAPARAAAQKRETAVSGETTNERDKPPKKRRLCKDEDASAALQGCIPASPVKQTKERTRSEQSFVDDSKGKIFRKNPQAANESPGLAETDRRRHRTRHITEHRKRASPSSSAPSSASSPHSSSSSSSCSALSSLSFAPESEPDVAPVGLPDLPEELLQQILDCCPNECLLVSHALAAAVRRRRRVLRLTPLHSSEPKAEHFLAAIRGYPQLRLLEVVNAPSLPARFFESLANSRTSCFPQRLEVLVLRKCLRLTSRLVRAITTRLRRLRAVDLQDNSSLDYTSVVYLRTLPHLERVALGVTSSNSRGASAHCSLTLSALLGPPSSLPSLPEPSGSKSGLSSSPSAGSPLPSTSPSSPSCPPSSCPPPSCPPPSCPSSSPSSPSRSTPDASLFAVPAFLSSRASGPVVSHADAREAATEQQERTHLSSRVSGTGRETGGDGEARPERKDAPRDTDLLESTQKRGQTARSSPPLKLLSLARCTAVSSLAPLINIAATLEFLDLRGCTALDDSNAAVLASLVNLQVLVLSDTGVTSTTVSAVAENCRKLEMLDISRIARLSKPAALLIPLYLLHLTRLKLSKNSAVDDECVRDCLTRLKSLALLDVSHCWRVTSGFCMPPLPQIPDGMALRRLGLFGCNVERQKVQDALRDAGASRVQLCLHHELPMFDLPCVYTNLPNLDLRCRSFIEGL
uniref:Leucine rich repeat-containing protein n=1 Tax=Neospora caninum (strain Liverpool) TaxID=572307 RepID=A0A0F7ULU3_NEOCL|nr:TPA: leucine rich repeat-containing protein [Neospora caninum Liverpool]